MKKREDRTVIYARVSTHEQNLDMQLVECRRLAEFRGWTVVEEFCDRGVSGSKTTRPALERLMAAVRAGKVSRVLVWKLDRFGRNAAHLAMATEELASLGVEFVSMTESLDSSTPAGRLVIGILASVAQMERELIRERTLAGLEHARRKGVRLGRKKSCTPGDVARRLNGGMSWREVASELGVGIATVGRRAREAADSGMLTIDFRPTRH